MAVCLAADVVPFSNVVSDKKCRAILMDKFPGCNETSLTVSPFDNKTGSSRISNRAGLLTPLKVSETIDFNDKGLKINLVPGTAIADCKKPIKAKLCFGDCIDLSKTDIGETLSTPDPLGSDKMEICGDELDSKLKNLKLSTSVRRELCEAFFWKSFMKKGGLYMSCAAVRGETSCETF